jgi:hypothetical protein
MYKYKYDKYIHKILNPPLEIKMEKLDDGRIFNIVRDDVLIGGTKQRIMGAIILANPDCDEFVYAGPFQGYAQVALAYVAKLLNKKATLFLSESGPLTKVAQHHNPNVKIIVLKYANLKKLKSKSEIYSSKDNICLLPFGLYTKEYFRLLANQIKSVLPNNFEHPKTMWLVAGSATILNALYLLFPKTYFNIVQVGKKIWPDQMDESRTTLYISDEKFWEIAKKQPPYPTVKTYDAKLWKYVLKYGKSGDYVWNVAKDI